MLRRCFEADWSYPISRVGGQGMGSDPQQSCSISKLILAVINSEIIPSGLKVRINNYSQEIYLNKVNSEMIKSLLKYL